MRLIFLALVTVSTGLLASAEPAQDIKEAASDPKNLYGVVEVGGSGVKAMLFEKTGDEVKFLKKYEPMEADAFSWSASSSGLVASAVTDIVKKMQTEFKVPDDHFDLVGSSGVPSDVRPALSDSIEQNLHLRMNYISVDQESQFVFRNLVPADKTADVVVLDLGSGNSKGTYAEVRSEGTRLVSFSMPFGTKTFAEEIDTQRQNGAFLITAESLSKQIIQPAVHDDAQIAPGMRHRPRIYLVGGIPWAMALVLHPFEAKQPLIRFRSAELEDLLTQMIKSPAAAMSWVSLSHSPRENAAQERRRAMEAAGKIGTIFTDNQIVAGAIILKAYLEQMNYRDREVYFNTQALYAWPQQYVLEMNAAKAEK